MPARPVVLDDLIADLRRVETWLTQSLGVAVEQKDEPEARDPFKSHDDLADLKRAIDRIRPLLWVYLTRQNEARDLNLGKPPASVRSLVDKAINISDRYVTKND
jgi:hypothetical protein